MILQLLLSAKAASNKLACETHSEPTKEQLGARGIKREQV
jgi:hypothetical protein